MNVKKILLTVILFAIGITWFIAYQHIQYKGTFDTIDFIASHINSRGEIQDVQDDLGVESIDDIKYYDTEKNLEIEFGKARIKFAKDKLETDEVIDALNRIHIKIRKNEESGEYKVYYNDEEVDLYIRE